MYNKFNEMYNDIISEGSGKTSKQIIALEKAKNAIAKKYLAVLNVNKVQSDIVRSMVNVAVETGYNLANTNN